MHDQIWIFVCCHGKTWRIEPGRKIFQKRPCYKCRSAHDRRSKFFKSLKQVFNDDERKSFHSVSLKRQWTAGAHSVEIWEFFYLRFYVKTNMTILEPQKMPFVKISESIHFDFSRFDAWEIAKIKLAFIMLFFKVKICQNWTLLIRPSDHLECSHIRM